MLHLLAKTSALRHLRVLKDDETSKFFIPDEVQKAMDHFDEKGEWTYPHKSGLQV